MLPDMPRDRAYAGPVLLGIDHLVIAVADPDAAASELGARLGLTPGGGGRHDRLGTFNRLVWLGDTYLELIGVFDTALAATSWLGAPALRALEAGGGLATWAVATDAIDDDVATLRARGSDVAKPIAGERLRPDGSVVRWRLCAASPLDPDHPPFLIEHDPTAAEWSPADRAERAAGPARLTHLELAVDDVNRTRQAYLRTVGLRFRPSLAGGGARDTDIGAQVVRLRPRRPADNAPRARVRVQHRSLRAIEFDAVGFRWAVDPTR
jgi:Glyoxalase-like domain